MLSIFLYLFLDTKFIYIIISHTSPTEQAQLNGLHLKTYMLRNNNKRANLVVSVLEL